MVEFVCIVVIVIQFVLFGFFTSNLYSFRLKLVSLNVHSMVTVKSSFFLILVKMGISSDFEDDEAFVDRDSGAGVIFVQLIIFTLIYKKTLFIYKPLLIFLILSIIFYFFNSIRFNQTSVTTLNNILMPILQVFILGMFTTRLNFNKLYHYYTSLVNFHGQRKYSLLIYDFHLHSHNPL